MSASFPVSVKTFTPKVDGPGNVIHADHINEITDEVTAIETELATVLTNMTGLEEAINAIVGGV